MKRFFLFLIFLSNFIMAKQVIIHYQKSEDLNWDIWAWPKGKGGASYNFSESDEFGDICKIDIADDVTELGYIVRLPDWSKKDIDNDRYIDTSKKVTNVWVKSNDPNTYYKNPDRPVIKYDKISGVINYYRFDRDYENVYIFAYVDKNKKEKILPEKVDDYVKFDINFEGKDIQSLSYEIYKSGVLDGSVKTIDEFKDGKFIVFNRIGDDSMYETLGEVKKGLKVKEVSIDTLNSIKIRFNSNMDTVNLKDFEIEGLDGKYKVQKNKSEVRLIFKNNIDLRQNYSVLRNKVKIGEVVRTKEFDQKYFYNKQLGSIYSKDKTEFVVWSPIAKQVNLVVYDNNTRNVYPMKYENGVYKYTLTGDNLGLEYNYEVKHDDNYIETTDPYAQAVTINGRRSVVVDIKPSDVDYSKNIDYNNPIIYELHVRDLSFDDNSNIKAKGKFNGLTELDTNYKGMPTGLSHIKNLGVTHVQLLPIYDFSKDSVDEENIFATYNWGYDPVNYNAVEGSYATKPEEPMNRVLELQNLVDTLHKNDLAVIMDVVYNHVFEVGGHSFNILVPGYYFRYDSNGNLTNGTGVGNDVASERLMVRKYIVDSLTHYATNYKLDGFRFDLMGILDVDTMNEAKEKLTKINPNIVLLGEGWHLGSLPSDMEASQTNAYKMPNIAFFNDNIRDDIKGSTFGQIGRGYVSGVENKEKDILTSIKGAKGLRGYTSADQLIQYVEAHDNMTLFDQLTKTLPEESKQSILDRHNLASSIVLLSQGTPFIHAGQEFYRTKNMDENSYKSSSKINMLDWKRAYKFKDNIDYISNLIKIRKKYDEFKMKDYEQIEKAYKTIKQDEFVIAYSINDRIFVIHNANNKPIEIELDGAQYNVLSENHKASADGLRNSNMNKIKVYPLSTTILEKLNQ